MPSSDESSEEMPVAMDRTASVFFGAASGRGLSAGVGPLRNNVIHATAHGTWAVTRRQRAEYGAGARVSQRGEHETKARGEQRSNDARRNQAQGHQKTQA